MPASGSIQNCVLKMPAQLRLPGERMVAESCSAVIWNPSPNVSEPAPSGKGRDMAALSAGMSSTRRSPT